MGKLIIYSILFLIFCSCDKEENLAEVTNPEQAILGKWEITHLGNGNQLTEIENPIAYEEYQQDSILLLYNYEVKILSEERYWFSDSILFISSINIAYDGAYYDTIVTTLPYKYKFLTHNKLRLDFQYPAINTTSIYKRIK